MANRHMPPPGIDESNVPAYFHGAIDRSEAEARLQAGGAKDGMFLVREKFPDTAYVLSVCADGQVFHTLFERQERADGSLHDDFVSDGFPFTGCRTVEEIVQQLTKPEAVETDLPVVKIPLPRPK